ncbi:Hypothetical protein CINCED_3A020506 [Cinara cedri]|nr:Hypothetical protein CINCED_3A020506 [Cinara cedri]
MFSMLHQLELMAKCSALSIEDEYDERSESVNDSFQKNAVAINNKPTSSLTLSKTLASPHVNSRLQEKTVAKAKSPEIGVLRNTTTALPKKAVKSNESPKINVPSKKPTKITKCAAVVKSNSSSVITKLSAQTTATDLRGDSLANKRDVLTRGTAYNSRSSSARRTVNDSFQKNAVAINNKPTSSSTLSKVLASPHVNSRLQEKTVAKAKSPEIGVSRNTTTALPKKIVKSNESPKINVPSKKPTKVTKCAAVVKSNSSSVSTKLSAQTTATDIRGDSLANKRDVLTRGTAYNSRSSSARRTVTVNASKLSYANLPKSSASSLPNDVSPSAEFDDQSAYDQRSAPCGYVEHDCGISAASFESDTNSLQRAGSHHCVTEWDSCSEVNGTDGYFDEASSDVPRRSRRGDGDAEKHAAGKSAVGKPSEFPWLASDDAFKFAPTKQFKIKKMNQVINVYLTPLGGSPKTPVRKACSLVGPLVSSSYINRQKKLKEIELTNMFIAKKILGAKPTISSFR